MHVPTVTATPEARDFLNANGERSYNRTEAIKLERKRSGALAKVALSAYKRAICQISELPASPHRWKMIESFLVLYLGHGELSSRIMKRGKFIARPYHSS